MTQREDIESGNVWPEQEQPNLEDLLYASLVDRGILQNAILDAIEGAVIVEFPKR